MLPFPADNDPNIFLSNLQTSSHHHPIPRVNGITTCRTFLLYIHTSFQEHLDNFKITLHDSHVDRINRFSSGETSTSAAHSMPTTEPNWFWNIHVYSSFIDRFEDPLEAYKRIIETFIFFYWHPVSRVVGEKYHWPLLISPCTTSRRTFSACQVLEKKHDLLGKLIPERTSFHAWKGFSMTHSEWNALNNDPRCLLWWSHESQETIKSKRRGLCRLSSRSIFYCYHIYRSNELRGGLLYWRVAMQGL